jgi:hypothetical protein
MIDDDIRSSAVTGELRSDEELGLGVPLAKALHIQ